MGIDNEVISPWIKVRFTTSRIKGFLRKASVQEKTVEFPKVILYEIENLQKMLEDFLKVSVAFTRVAKNNQDFLPNFSKEELFNYEAIESYFQEQHQSFPKKISLYEGMLNDFTRPKINACKWIIRKGKITLVKANILLDLVDRLYLRAVSETTQPFRSN